MPTYMDYTVSSKPIRIIDRTMDKSKLLLRALTLLGVGHLPQRWHFRTNAMFQDYALVYIADGAGTYQVNEGEQQEVEKGSFFLFDAKSTFNYGPKSQGTWDEFYFSIEGSRIQEWLQTGLIEEGRVYHTLHDPAQQSKINHIFTLMDSGIPANLDRAALLLESFLYELVQSSRIPLHLVSDEAPHIKIMDDIASTLDQPFDADTICQRHHISMSTLRRIIHKHTGYSLHEYVHRLKVSEAKNLLLNTSESIKTIAYSLGFKDVFYFSRLFKKFVGASPVHFRKSN